MGAGAVGGHSTSRGNQVYPQSSSAGYTSASTRQSSGARSLQRAAQTSLSQPQASIATMPNKPLTCETCDINFTFFKRKKICRDCRRFFCSTCLPKPPSSEGQNGRQCGKCTILTSGKFSRAQLQAWKVKDMRCFLDCQNIPTSKCKEKHDLIDLLLVHFCLESDTMLNDQREHDQFVEELADRMHNSSLYMSSTLPHQVPDEDDNTPPACPEVQTIPSQPTTEQTTVTANQSEVEHLAPSVSNINQAEPQGSTRGEEEEDAISNMESILSGHLRERQLRELRETLERMQEEFAPDEPESRPSIKRATIDDVQSEEAVEGLTVRQLKEILVNNFVDYKGCCEKHELVDRVKRLWVETQANKQRVAVAMDTAAAKDGTSDQPSGSGTADTGNVVPTSGDHHHHDPEKDVCKICMDAPTDCILLECGHMITCTKCGKRLADCPICRQYITRVVHVFRS